MSPSLPATCRREVERLRAEILRLESAVEDFLPLDESFAASDPAPEVARELETELRRVLSIEGPSFPLQIECRGLVCALKPLDPPRRGYELDWTCWVRDGKHICRPEWESGGWIERVMRSQLTSPRVPRVALPRWDTEKDVPKPTYVRLRSVVDRGKANPMDVLCQFSARVRKAAVFERCLGQPPQRGSLVLGLRAPANSTGSIAEGEPRLEVTASGALDGTPLGRCVVDRLKNVAVGLKLPDQMWEDLSFVRTLELPTDMTIWGENDPCP